MMNQPPQKIKNPVQPQMMMNRSHPLMAAGHSQAMNQSAAAQSQPMSSGPQMMLDPSYNPGQSQDPNHNPNKKFPINNFKGKKVFAVKDSIKFDSKPLCMGSVSGIPLVSSASDGSTQRYKPRTLKELQTQNRLKARKLNNNNQFAPYAPPCPVTPAALPTPKFSLSRDVLGEIAEEGVDDEDIHIAQLKEENLILENLILKAKLFLKRRELRSLRFLKRRRQAEENRHVNESEDGGSDVTVVTAVANH